MRFRVLEDGSLQQIANQANQAAAGLDRTSEANARLHRTTRGASNMQGNQTRAFAATANSAGGLVAAYATLMAHTFALTAAFGALQRASALDQLEQGLIAVGNAAGQNLPYVSERLQELTDGAITLKEAMEATALATSAGFSTTQLESLTRVAKGASLALGRDMGDALTRLVKGTAKLEPEILDELGIMVRLDEASQKYAESLGKTVGQLSRFEKQQAFLNATIEQGEKKFSMIFDNVDAEPFAQLSASFRDLVKDITTFINKGAIPLIKFLSNFPTAMVGGLLLFASSITKKLLPALGDLATANSATASIAAASARRAANAVSAEYTAAASRVNSAFRTVPASLRAVETQFRSGSLSVQEYRAHLLTLQRSERSRAAALQASGPNSTSIARQQELDQIRQLIAATEQLIATESRRGATSNRGERAQSESRSARNQAGIQRRMQGAGVQDSFNLAATGARLQFREVTRATGALNTMRAGLTATARSAALFGSALLNAVPIIGQILFFGSMLIPVFQSLVGKQSELSKAVKEVGNSFSSFSDIAQQLRTHLLEVTDAEERFASKLSARVGITAQLTAGMSTLVEANKKDNKKEEERLVQEVIAAQEDLVRKNRILKAQEAKGLTKGKGLDADLAAQENSTRLLTIAKLNLKTITERMNSISKEEVRNLLEQAKARAEAGGMTEILSNEIKQYNALLEEGGLLAGTGRISIQQLGDAFSEVSEPLSKLQQEQKAVTDITTKMANATIASTAKAQGAYGDLHNGVVELSNSLRNVQTEAKKTGNLKDVKVIPPETLAQVERLKDALNLDPEFFKGKGIRDFSGIVDEIAKKIKANNVQIAQGPIETKRLNDLAKEYGQISGNNASAKTKELEIIKQAKQETLATLNATYENLAAETEAGVVTNDMLKVQAQINQVTAQITAHKNDSLKVAIAEVNQEKTKVDLLTKQAGFNIAIAKSNLKIKQNELKVKNLLEKKDAKEKSPAAAAKKLFDETKKDRLAIIERERKMKLASIKMEYKLLEAQTKLARAQAADMGLDTAIYDELLQLQKGAQVLANQAANRAAAAASSDIAVEGVTTNLAAGDEEKQIPLDKRDRARDVLSSAADTMAGLGPEGESLAAGMNMIESFSASFDTALSTMADSSATNAEKISAGLGVASSLIGGMMQMQKAATADKLRAIDQEIAAEKARDGQSASSVAKLQGLEKKKEATARKAFEKEKKMKIAQTIISTAQGAIAAYTSLAMIPIVGPALGAAAAAMVISMGAQQVSMIQATSFSGGGSVGGGPSSISVGQKGNSVDLAKGNNQAGELAFARGGQGTGQMDNFTPAFTGYKNRASGGNTGFIVGEQGPELFTPSIPGDITSADETADMEAATPTNVTFNINTIDASGIEEVLTVQRGNIIKMIRDAANEQGQLFLEAVEESKL